MRFAFAHNRKNDKPKCLIIDLFPQGVSVFHLSNNKTESVEAGSQTASLYLSGAPYPRMKHGHFLDDGSVAKG
jgi:hypothetical protein